MHDSVDIWQLLYPCYESLHLPQSQDTVQEGLEVDETGKLAVVVVVGKAEVQPVAGVLIEDPGQVAVVEEAGHYV